MTFPRIPSGMPPARLGRRRAAFRLGTCLATALLALAMLPPVAGAAVSNASLNNSKMLQFMNAERAARGLPPLARDSRLDALAQSWANKMAAARTMYHPSPPQAVASAGYRSGAQNLAWHDNSLSASWAHNFWMNSSPHRKNILDPAFTHAGLAMACNPSGGRYPYVFATVEFGGNAAPLGSAPPVSPHVAGGESVAGAGCDGSGEPPAPPPPPPAPAPPPPPAAPAPAAKTSPRANPSPADVKQASPRASSSAETPSAGRPSPGRPPVPAASGSPPAPLAVATPSTGPPPPPEAGKPAPVIEAVAASSARETQRDSGALIALVAGLSGILLMTRMNSRKRRRAAPRHAISRR